MHAHLTFNDQLAALPQYLHPIRQVFVVCLSLLRYRMKAFWRVVRGVLLWAEEYLENHSVLGKF
jgi:hypothetical protein